MKRLTLAIIFYLVVSTVFVYADFRTIMVDGEVSDWVGVPALVTDPPGDQTGSLFEDIKAVHVVNDHDNLYFWMELYNDLPLIGFLAEAETNFDGSELAYLFFIDNMPGTGDPDYGGADYAIEYSITGLCNVIAINVTATQDQPIGPHTYLFKWNETGGLWSPDVACSSVEGNALGPNIEVRVAWDCIGGMTCFNAMFMAKTGDENTDYAPDREGDIPVTIQVCPCLPVAGELLPSSWARPVTYYLLIAVLISSVMVSAYSLRRKAVKVLP